MDENTEAVAVPRGMLNWTPESIAQYWEGVAKQIAAQADEHQHKQYTTPPTPPPSPATPFWPKVWDSVPPEILRRGEFHCTQALFRAVGAGIRIRTAGSDVLIETEMAKALAKWILFQIIPFEEWETPNERRS